MTWAVKSSGGSSIAVPCPADVVMAAVACKATELCHMILPILLYKTDMTARGRRNRTTK